MLKCAYAMQGHQDAQARQRVPLQGDQHNWNLGQSMRKLSLTGGGEQQHMTYRGMDAMIAKIMNATSRWNAVSHLALNFLQSEERASAPSQSSSNPAPSTPNAAA